MISYQTIVLHIILTISLVSGTRVNDTGPMELSTNDTGQDTSHHPKEIVPDDSYYDYDDNFNYDNDYNSYDYDAENSTATYIKCAGKICVRKCCEDGFILTPLGFCVERTKDTPVFHVKFEHKDGRSAEPNGEVLILYGHPVCTDYGPLPKHRSAIVLPDGRLFTAYEIEYRDHQSYCVDAFSVNDESNSSITKVSQSAMTCYTNYQPTGRELFRRYSHQICIIFSLLSLLCLIVVHVAVSELRRPTGLCLLSHMSCLFVFYLALFVVNVSDARYMKHDTCVTLGLILHISMVATYIWLTVMCFDIWTYMRLSIKGIPFSHMGTKTLFLKYSAVAWSTVLGIFLITATLQFLPQDSLPQGVIRPAIGVTRCFIIEEDANLFLYLFLILGILCFFNLTLVIWTIVYLKQGGANIWCWSKKSFHAESSVFNANNIDSFWQRFQIFAMTIFVWCTEVLSWKIPPQELWELSDLVTLLQGVIILLIFLQQKKKRKLMLGLLHKLLRRAQLATQKNNATSSSEETTSTECRLGNSDLQMVERIKKLSKQEETVASTIAKSLHDNKIEIIPLDQTVARQTTSETVE